MKWNLCVPKLKRLTAKQVLAILMQFGFVIASQRRIKNSINDSKP
jgi:hypothetical protein